MDVLTIYSIRDQPRNEIEGSILETISNLKISTKLPFKKPHPKRRHNHNQEEAENWRENALKDMVRKVREKDDADYDTVNSSINKLTKQNYQTITEIVIEKIRIREDAFRLRVTTLLFDTSVRQPNSFFAPLLADLYQDITREYPEALNDLMTQISVFDTLYETSEGVAIPPSTDPGYNEAIQKWTKQKDLKRGFAAYLSELYARSLIKEETIVAMVTSVVEDIKETVRLPKTETTEQHVDALAKFVFILAGKVAIKASLDDILKIPRAETPSLNMKSRFKLEDAMKASK